MDWGWFWQGLITNLLTALFDKGLAALLLAAIVISAFVAYLKKSNPSLADQVLYGLIAFCVVIVAIWAVKSMIASPKEAPQITSKNVEANIHGWIHHFGLGIRKISDPDSYFAYEVTLRNGTTITLKRTKEFDNYITLTANLEMGQEYRILLEKMTDEQRKLLVAEILRELARTKIEGVISSSLKNISLHRKFPITNSLTEDIFIERIHELAFAFNIASATIVLRLQRPQERITLQ